MLQQAGEEGNVGEAEEVAVDEGPDRRRGVPQRAAQRVQRVLHRRCIAVRPRPGDRKSARLGAGWEGGMGGSVPARANTHWGALLAQSLVGLAIEQIVAETYYCLGASRELSLGKAVPRLRLGCNLSNGVPLPRSVSWEDPTDSFRGGQVQMTTFGWQGMASGAS